MKRIQFISSLFIIPFIPYKELFVPFVWKIEHLCTFPICYKDGIEYQLGITNSHIWFVKFGKDRNIGYEFPNTEFYRKDIRFENMRALNKAIKLNKEFILKHI